MGGAGALGGVAKEEKEGQEEDVSLAKNFSIASLMAGQEFFKGQENAEENIKRLAKGKNLIFAKSGKGCRSRIRNLPNPISLLS